jgi:hypothetical protein
MPARLSSDFPRRALIEDLAGRLRAAFRIRPGLAVRLASPRRQFRALGRRSRDRGACAGLDDWIRIKLDFEDEPPSLLLVDLARIEEAPEQLREQMRDEGILVCHREASRGKNG